MSSNYLVCYDIRDELRLTRVFKKMKSSGIHIQYSVFFCRLSKDELIKLKNALNEIIDRVQDDVRIYPLPSNTNVVVMGQGDRVPEGVTVLL